MIRRITLTAALLAAGFSCNLNALTDDETAYLQTFGWLIGQQSRVESLGLNQAETKEFLIGLQMAIDGKEAPQNIPLIGPDMQLFLKKKATAFSETFKKRMEERQKAQEKRDAEAAKTAQSASDKFFPELVAKNKNVKVTESGLHYEIIVAGSDEKPSATDKVKVHYEGTLIDGTVFDSSIKRGEPITFGLNQVIPGWTEGLQLIGKGGKAKLYIPAKLAYKDARTGAIPPNSTLIFDVELLDINPATAVPATQ